MLKKSLFCTSLGTLVMAMNAHALVIDEQTPIKSNVVLTKPASNTLLANPAKKQVYLMNVKLTNKEKATILKYKPVLNRSLAARQELPEQVDVGMNHTPVLDQGQHGSCVTFAVTGAVDALYGVGDYISQLCNLEVGRTFKVNGYYPSGWNGSWGPLVLDQINRIGVASKMTQTSQSCADFTEYPLNDPEEIGNVMSLKDFYKVSEYPTAMTWKPYLHFSDRFDEANVNAYDGDKLLSQVKQTLVNAKSSLMDGGVVVFGVLLPVDYCQVGACGSFKAANDTWVLTDTMKADASPNFGGHEMVITGYDDNAVVTDNEGNQHKGLLTLRNSWSEFAGDNGNYYMSYEFFEQFVLEVNRIYVDFSSLDGKTPTIKKHQ